MKRMIFIYLVMTIFWVTWKKKYWLLDDTKCHWQDSTRARRPLPILLILKWCPVINAPIWHIKHPELVQYFWRVFVTMLEREIFLFIVLCVWKEKIGPHTRLRNFVESYYYFSKQIKMGKGDSWIDIVV